MTLYNDNDPFCVRWLSNLISAGHLPPGVVDGRTVADLTSADTSKHDHVDFFAGIGGWGLARRIAGWPESSPLWTASLPCQPFSPAGLRRQTRDRRDLWPDFHRLIRECRPRTVVGEQVAGALGLRWADRVRHDLEREGYAFAAACLPAACVGAPHRRERLWWVAHAYGQRFQENRAEGSVVGAEPPRSADSPVADADREHRRSVHETAGRWGEDEPRHTNRTTVAHADGQRPVGGIQAGEASEPCDRSLPGEPWGRHYETYADGFRRKTPVEPALRPVVDGVPGGVGRLRAYGNAVVPQVAAVFLRSVMEIVR